MSAKAACISQRPTCWNQGYVICPTLVFSASCLLTKMDRWNSHQKKGRATEFPHCGKRSINVFSKISELRVPYFRQGLWAKANGKRYWKWDGRARSHLSFQIAIVCASKHWSTFQSMWVWRKIYFLSCEGSTRFALAEDFIHQSIYPVTPLFIKWPFSSWT